MVQKILITDDNPSHRELIKTHLELGVPGVEITEAESASMALEILSENTFNLIMLDYNLPGMNGIQFLEESLEMRGDTPVIMVTGSGSEQVAVKAFKLGVTDYLIKTIDLPIQIVTVVKEIFSSSRKSRGMPSANLSSVESGIRLIQEYQEELNKKKISGGSIKETMIVEFKEAPEFNKFSRWVSGQENVEIKKVDTMENKYITMISVSPVGFKKIS